MNSTPQSLVTDRYGVGHEPHPVALTPAVESMLSHRSIRAFTDEPVPEETLSTMVAAAQSASTSSNLHQWSVVAVLEPARKRELQHFARSATLGREPEFIATAPLVLLWVADQSRNRAIVETAGGDASIFETLEMFLMASIDASLAAQNAAIAAESMGLGIVYLGAMRNHARELADFLELPNHSFVVFGMAVGVPDPAKTRIVRPRPAQSVVVHEQRYEVPKDDEWVREYEDVFSRFRAANGMRNKTWAETVESATGLGYLDGRDQLRATLEERGFGMR